MWQNRRPRPSPGCGIGCGAPGRIWSAAWLDSVSYTHLDVYKRQLCARCTRFSDQIAGDPFIALVERGALQQVGIYEEQPFESYFSGNTVQICPVGALTGARYRFRSRPFDLVSTPSVCEHCASGCSLRVDHRRGVVLRRMAAPNMAVNEEWNLSLIHI